MILTASLIFLLTGICWWLYFKGRHESYLALSLSIMLFLGFLNRFAAFLWGDNSGALSYLNLTLFIPATVAGLLLMVKSRRNKLIFGAFRLFYFLIFIYFIVGFLFRDRLQAAIDFASYSIFVGMFFYVALSKMEPDRFLEKIKKSINLSILILCPYAIAQYVFGPNAIDALWMSSIDTSIAGQPLPFFIRCFSMMASPGHFAIFCVVAEIVILGAYINASEGKSGAKIVFLFILLLLGVAVSGVRSAMLAFIAIALFAVLSKKTMLGLVKILPIILLLIIPLAMRIKYEDLGYVFDRFLSFQDVVAGEDISLKARLDTLDAVKKLILENPFGYGLGATGRFVTDGMTNIDNGYIELLFTAGYLSVPVLLIALAGSLLRKSKSETEAERWAIWTARGASFMIIFMMLFGNLVKINIALFLIALVAFSYRKSFQRKLFKPPQLL